MELLQRSIGLKWRHLSGGMTNGNVFGSTLVVGTPIMCVLLALIVGMLLLDATLCKSDKLNAFLVPLALPWLTNSARASAVTRTLAQASEHEGQAAA